MTHSKDRDPKVLSVEKAISKLNINRRDFFDVAEKLDIKLLIYPPDNVAVYLAEKNYANPKTHGYLPKHNNGTPVINVTKVIKFLCLSSSEYTAALSIEGLKQSKFYAVAQYCANTDKITINHPHSNTRGYQLKGMFKSPYLDGIYVTAKLKAASNNPIASLKTIEKPIKIKPKKMFILSEDLKAIRQELSKKKTNYGKFEPGTWTSVMLADLNEASTFFHSSVQENTSESVESKTIRIKEWLRKRWGSECGEIRLDEATRAIDPGSVQKGIDPESGINRFILEARNDYASETLTRINDAAYRFFGGAQKKDVKYNYREALLGELKTIYKFQGRLAVAISCIIRPHTQNRKKSTD